MDSPTAIDWRRCGGEWSTYIIALLLFLCGTFDSFVDAFLSRINVKCSTEPPNPFYHPIALTFLMFFSQSLLLVPHFLIRSVLFCFSRCRRTKEASFDLSPSLVDNDWLLSASRQLDVMKSGYENRSPTSGPNPLLFLPATLCDLGTWLFANASFIILSSSNVYTFFMGGVSVVVAGLLSWIVLRKQLFAHNVISILTIFLGWITLVLCSFFQHGVIEQWNQSTINTVFGTLLLLGSPVLTSCMLVYEEFLCRKYPGVISPFEIRGWEGFWGVTLMLFGLVGASYAPFAWYDSVSCLFVEIVTNWQAAFWVVLHALGSFGYNFFQVELLIRIGAVQMLAIDTLRMFSTWILVLVWEDQSFWILDLSGRLLVFIGVATYIRLIKIPLYDDYYQQKIEESGFGVECDWSDCLEACCDDDEHFQRMDGLKKVSQSYLERDYSDSKYFFTSDGNDSGSGGMSPVDLGINSDVEETNGEGGGNRRRRKRKRKRHQRAKSEPLAGTSLPLSLVMEDD